MTEELELSESRHPAAIGKYQIFASLGRGGMADVYLAVARGPMGFNKLTVIKRLRADHASDPALSTMLLDEARLAARLSHPNVVHTYEVGEDHGSYFIAMEYLEGQPLVRIARAVQKGSKRIDPETCARVVADALSGLHYAHELKDYDGTPLQIIHRDVSPHNIFVTYDGAVKLMDFGIAKATSSATQTEVGVLKGKISYMAPEQAMGEAIDRRADIFAMGIVLWELVTGERLFSIGAAATLHKLAAHHQPRASEKVPDLAPKLDALIARSLEKDPEKRFQTAQAMRAELEDFLSSCGGGPRRDDVGRRVGELFEETRQNVHRQIQIHMAEVSVATSTGELAALNADVLKRTAPEPTPSGRNLLSLVPADGGSGSELVPAASPPSLPIESGRSKGRFGPPLFVTALALTVCAVAFFVLRPRESPDRDPRTASAPPVSRPPPPAEATTPVPILDTSRASPPAPPASAAPVASPPQRRERVAAPARPAPAPSPSAIPAVPGVAVAEAGTGYLTLDTYPWTRVSESGRALGVTPLVHVALPAGSHTLTLENPDQGIKQQYSVTLKADETVSRRLGLK